MARQRQATCHPLCHLPHDLHGHVVKLVGVPQIDNVLRTYTAPHHSSAHLTIVSIEQALVELVALARVDSDTQQSHGVAQDKL